MDCPLSVPPLAWQVRLGSWRPLLPSLTSIDLHGCSRLTMLPDWVTRLEGLRTLRLGRCTALASLPATIGRLGASLEAIDLHDCSSLEYLPEGMADLGRWSSLSAAPLGTCRIACSIGGLDAFQALTYSASPCVTSRGSLEDL